MKVAYATIVYKNRRQKYDLFFYKSQISANFFLQNKLGDKCVCSLFLDPCHGASEGGDADIPPDFQFFVSVKPHFAFVCFAVDRVVDGAVHPLFFCGIIAEMGQHLDLVGGGVALFGIGVHDVALGRAVLERRVLHPHHSSGVGAGSGLVNLDLGLLRRLVILHVVDADNLVSGILCMEADDGKAESQQQHNRDAVF